MSQDISTFCKVKSGEQIMAYAKYKNVENSCVQLGVISTFLGPTMSKVNINRLDVKYTAGENCKYDVNRKASITYSFYCDIKASTATFTISSSDKCSYNVQYMVKSVSNSSENVITFYHLSFSGTWNVSFVLRIW